MAFFPSPLTLIVRASMSGGTLVIKDASVLLKYLAVDDVFPTSQSEGGCGRRRRTFAIASIARLDAEPDECGNTPTLPTGSFGLLDVEIDGLQLPRRPNGPDKRLVAFRFDGSALSTQCDDGNSELFEALLEEATLRVDVAVDNLYDTSLLVKLQLAFEPPAQS